MSIMLSGTLSVQRIAGSHGEFSVGKLDCALGILNIKGPELDQYETGKYKGRFGVERIYPHGYMTRTGCFIVEVRAILNEYIIHSDDPDELDDAVALTEQDPLESTPTVLPPVSPEPPAKPEAQPPVEKPQDLKPKASKAEPEPQKTVDPLAELFGELWPLGSSVTLDPTTIRSDAENHRKRTQYLKSQGYVFKASSQSWVKEGVAVAELEEVYL